MNSIIKTWPNTKGKINVRLGRKNPKFEKYTSFKPYKSHLIYRTSYVIAKVKCNAVMVFG